MSVNFNATTYEEALVSVRAKQERLTQEQHRLDEIKREADAVMAQRKAQAEKLVFLRDGIDLRSEAKKNRSIRTNQLREAGILLPNEYIEKVREPRTKNQK